MTGIIETPRGAVIVGPNGKAELKFNPNFGAKQTQKYSRVQKFIDNAVLTKSEKFTPLLTSMLIKSGILGTDIGSGTVSWIAPYAKRQYYKGRRPGTQQAGPLRGRFWFERMKAVFGKEIIQGAKKLAGK